MSETGGLEIEASVSVALGRMADELRHARSFRDRQQRALSQPMVSGQMTISGGAGVVDEPAKLRAMTGYYWGIRRITVAGFTAGTVIPYKNSLNGEPMAPFAAAATATFGRGELMLNPGDRLLFSGSGITAAAGFIQYWVTFDQFEQWFLPFYIG